MINVSIFLFETTQFEKRQIIQINIFRTNLHQIEINFGPLVISYDINTEENRKA